MHNDIFKYKINVTNARLQSSTLKKCYMFIIIVCYAVASNRYNDIMQYFR